MVKTPIEQLRPPKGAPNVLIDDCGFGAASAFGGPCATPGAEKLATGEHQVRMEFANDGGGIGKGGKVTLVASLVGLPQRCSYPPRLSSGS